MENKRGHSEEAIPTHDSRAAGRGRTAFFPRMEVAPRIPGTSSRREKVKHWWFNMRAKQHVAD